MDSLRRRGAVACAAVIASTLMVAGCSAGAGPSGPSATASADATLVAVPTTSQAADVAPAQPSLEITYDLDGESVTVRSAIESLGCTSAARPAVALDGHSASALFPGVGDDGPGPVTASILGDSLVAFQGEGTLTVHEESQGLQRVTVVDLPGTAYVAQVAEGESPAIGDVDLSTAPQVPATLTATLDCATEQSAEGP